MYLVIVGLLLILRIALFVYFVATEGQYLVPDSAGYMNLATNLLENQTFSSSLKFPLELDFFRTPGYPSFLVFLKYIGVGGSYWVVFWQELVYGLSLWIFYYYGQPLFGKKITRASLLFLLLEPGGFAYPKFILSETLFLPFIIMGLLLIGHYLKKTDWRYLFLGGFMMGLGILVRPVLLYFPIIICFTLIAFDFQCKQRWLHTGLLLLTVVLTISPWLVRNQHYSDKLFISGQHSNLLANYHVPLVWESTKKIPFSEGRIVIANVVKTELELQEQQLGHPLSIIENYKAQQDIAVKELTKYPDEYAKQWGYGILKTMMGMNLTEVYYVLNIQPDRIHFYDIQELDFVNKVWVFLKGQDEFVLIMVILRGIITLFALLGALIMMARKDCFLWIILLANFYFICVPGPMGVARFRFPVEVFWFIQAYFGYIWLSAYLNTRLVGEFQNNSSHL